MDFYMPAKVFTGVDSLRNHGKELCKLGRRCLIVTGASSAKRCGALDDALAVLAENGIAYALYDRVGSNPAVASCMEAGKMAASFSAEFVLGIGGGSPLDAAKAAAVFAANPELDEAGFYAKAWERAPLPIALIGTTSGTGSEVTKVSVLTDSKGKKHSIHDDRIYASVSFGDPRYTMNLPRAVTLSTGIDVLTHCAESWFNKKANDISRAFAVKGIRMLLTPLRDAADGKELTLEDRETLYNASILGGLAICVTGTCFPHNVGYYLTEHYKVPHGIACAAFLPELLRHTAVACPEYTDEFYSRIGCSEQKLLDLTAKIMPEFDFRLTPEEIEKALPRWENNGSVTATVGTVTQQEIRACLEKLT